MSGNFYFYGKLIMPTHRTSLTRVHCKIQLNTTSANNLTFKRYDGKKKQKNNPHTLSH